MKKIPSLFQRNYEGDYLVRPELVPGTEWVLAGEGMATRKWDGTAVRITPDPTGLGALLWKRYDAKEGRTPPPSFEPAQDRDEKGHLTGWVLASRSDPADRWIFEAFDSLVTPAGLGAGLELAGTYEACGPKIGANPERFDRHILVPHGADILTAAPIPLRTIAVPATVDEFFAALKDYLARQDIEGIVWHHTDGRMVKIKTRDFGLRRGAMS